MSKRKRGTTTSFILELPLRVDSHSARILRAHFEAARNLYNALLGEACRRLNRLKNSPEWQAAKQIPFNEIHKAERKATFNTARTKYEFSEYDLHKYSTQIRQSWIGEHIDSNTAQKLATRAFRAVERIAKGQARKVRFRSKGRGIDSVEGKTNVAGIRFVLNKPTDGNLGKVVWGKLSLPAIIDWQDEVIRHGLSSRVKYVRIVRRKANSFKAQGADCKGYRYYAQLVLEGRPYQKPKNAPGKLEIGLDIGPSSIAIVSQCGEVARREKFCSEIEPNANAKRKLQRRLVRQRRANNLQNFDEKGRAVKPVKGKGLIWHDSRNYLDTLRKLSNTDRRLAAYRKSLHGRLVNAIIKYSNTVKLEKLSYKTFQKRYGRSVVVRAPGMFVEILRRTVARTAGTILEFATYHTRLSQTCHACGSIKKKPLSQRWQVCDCGITPIQRDLYSAWLASHITVSPNNPKEQPFLSSTQCQQHWESAEPHLQAVLGSYTQRAKEGVLYPRSFGLAQSQSMSAKNSSLASFG